MLFLMVVWCEAHTHHTIADSLYLTFTPSYPMFLNYVYNCHLSTCTLLSLITLPHPIPPIILFSQTHFISNESVVSHYISCLTIHHLALSLHSTPHHITPRLRHDIASNLIPSNQNTSHDATSPLQRGCDRGAFCVLERHRRHGRGQAVPQRGRPWTIDSIISESPDVTKSISILHFFPHRCAIVDSLTSELKSLCDYTSPF